jgi:hypothetical protein
MAPDKLQKQQQTAGEARDRIARVLYERNGMARLAWSRPWEDLTKEIRAIWLVDADAIIQALDLRREWGVKERDEPAPGWLSDANDLPVREGETLMCRLITPWEPTTGDDV